jgi:hypothetical protein
MNENFWNGFEKRAGVKEQYKRLRGAFRRAGNTDYYFDHHELRDAVQHVRDNYGLDSFRGLDPQELAFKARVGNIGHVPHVRHSAAPSPMNSKSQFHKLKKEWQAERKKKLSSSWKTEE